MNVIVKEGQTHSPIYIPPFDGLGSFKLRYEHEEKRATATILKISLTVIISIESLLTSEKFKVMSVNSKYRINVNGFLTVEDLAKIWIECAQTTVDIFNGFEKKQFNEVHKIEVDTIDQLRPHLSTIIDWYYLASKN